MRITLSRLLVKIERRTRPSSASPSRPGEERAPPEEIRRRMSREQRRTSGKPSPTGDRRDSRRTPVKVGGGGPPLVPIAIAGGAIVIIALIVYLVLQAGGGSSSNSYDKAEADTSASIPGTYVVTQGRGHETGLWSKDRPPTPFCPGVEWSGAPAGAASATPAAAASPTPAATTAPGATPTVQKGCYNSNPPSSGEHLAAQANVDIGNGIIIKLPPDPDIYPPEVEIPRDSIAHILEHAGVFVGYNCPSGDTACDNVIEQLKTLVTDRVNNGNDRVVMAHDNDLVSGTIGMSSWTRVYVTRYQDFDLKLAKRFMDTNSCRYDPEGICPR
jgi:hypothetical protein